MDSVRKHSVVCVYSACTVNEYGCCRNVIRDLCFVFGKLEYCAVFEDRDIVFIHAESYCHLFVETEHAVFTVNRNEELRLDEGMEHHELIPVSVA